MKFSRKVKSLITFFILINAVIGLAYWLVSKEIDKNTNEIVDLNNELNLQLNREKQIKSFKDLSEDISNEREELELYFVSQDGAVSFIKEVENLASLAGVSIDIREVSVDEYVDGDNVSEVLEILTLEMDTSGSWNNNFYFLNLLETIPYKTFVTNFNLSSSTNNSEDDDGVIWRTGLTLKVFKSK